MWQTRVGHPKNKTNNKETLKRKQTKNHDLLHCQKSHFFSQITMKKTKNGPFVLHEAWAENGPSQRNIQRVDYQSLFNTGARIIHSV